MKTQLEFEFIADKQNSTITVRREFAAKRQLVWDCHTKSELLDQWFAPKPFTTKTKSMDFREGGHWHYAMIDPEGKHYWGLTEYVKISPIDAYHTRDIFADEDGNPAPDMPVAKWDVTFTDKDGNTVVQTIVQYDSLEDLEKVINMGMKEGLTSTLEKLDELLVTLK